MKVARVTDLLLEFGLIEYYLLVLATYRPLGVIRAQLLAVLILPRLVYEKCYSTPSTSNCLGMYSVSVQLILQL